MNHEPNIHRLMEILAKEPPRYKFDRVREGAGVTRILAVFEVQWMKV